MLGKPHTRPCSHQRKSSYACKAAGAMSLRSRGRLPPAHELADVLLVVVEQRLGHCLQLGLQLGQVRLPATLAKLRSTMPCQRPAICALRLTLHALKVHHQCI